MAINPETQYPGKIAPSTPDYPYGAARNITLPGDGTGTPWEAALVNDIFGWQQALLSSAGVVPSGSPDKVGASQYLEAARIEHGRNVANKAAALNVAVKPATALTIKSKDGGVFLPVTGGSPGDFTDNGGTKAGTVIVPTGGDGSEAWVRLFGGHYELLWFVGDGTGDVDAQLGLAIAAAAGHMLSGSGLDISLTQTQTVPNNTIVDLAGSALAFLSVSVGTLFDLSGVSNSAIRNGRFNANGTTPAESFIELSDASNCEITNNEFLNPPASNEGTIRLGGAAVKNKVIGNKVNSSAGSAVVIAGTASQNTVSDNKFAGNVGFGVKLTGSSSYNVITGNISEFGGIELVGITLSSSYNVVSNNIAIGTNDNGFSLSGSKNTCTGNIARNCAKAGIWSWGSENTITGNTCFNNNTDDAGWAGIGVSANYGGTGQNNAIAGNMCGNQSTGSGHFNSYRVAGSTYSDWQASTEYTKTGQGTYVTNGLNVYVMVTEGTVISGTTPPTHTSGEVSDGAIVWRYVNTFENEANSVGNSFVGNVAGKSQDEAYQDVSGGVNPMLGDKSGAPTFAKLDALKIGSADSIIQFIAQNVIEARLTPSEFRPEADIGLSLGVPTRRFSSVYGVGFFVGDGTASWKAGNGSPEGVQTAPVGSIYSRLDGGAGTTFYVKESGAGNTGWVAK